jgi:glycosyltransferase involved in cell wall biosynthesis
MESMEKSRIKKVLILTYYWPPSGGAGVQRWLKFVKYLPQFGWEPIIYTAENPEIPETDPSLEQDIPSGITILKQPIKEPYNAYKRLMGRKKEERINAAFLSEKKQNPLLERISVFIRGNFFIPDARMFWIKPSIRFLNDYLVQNPVDVIISTGPPHSLHLIAQKIAKQNKIPWLADFRDPWTKIDFYQDLMLTKPADIKHHRLEKEVLRHADAISVISNTMGQDFNEIHPRKYHVITNGFDTDDIRREKIEPDKKFSIAHIGTLTQSRNPETLWQVLEQLTKSDRDLARKLEIMLIGKVDHTVKQSLEKHRLMDYVTHIPFVPHDEVNRYQKAAQLLLLLINNTPNARMILTGKFFEYLAAKRPILCLGPSDGDAAQILEETGSGILVEPNDVPKLKEVVKHFFDLYQEDKLQIQSQNIEQYSRKNLTKKLSYLLDELVGSTIGSA